jgi:hypothetical protein
MKGTYLGEDNDDGAVVKKLNFVPRRRVLGNPRCVKARPERTCDEPVGAEDPGAVNVRKVSQ